MAAAVQAWTDMAAAPEAQVSEVKQLNHPIIPLSSETGRKDCRCELLQKKTDTIFSHKLAQLMVEAVLTDAKVKERTSPKSAAHCMNKHKISV